jgi:phage RecT family recombinase
MSETIQKVLSLVDFMGSEKALADYQGVVTNILPVKLKKEAERYWSMYAQIFKAAINNPKITNKKSIISCLFSAPKLGLNPDPSFGQIFFIPYSGVLTYQVGYKGYVQLLYNNGFRVFADLVYEKDEFDYFVNEGGQHYHHRPNIKLSQKDRGREICAYSCISDGAIKQIHYMDSFHIDEIKKIVLARMGASSTPWKNTLYEPEMRKKTCLRRHQKYEPVSYEMARVIEHEENDERGEIKIDEYTEIEGLEIPENFLPEESVATKTEEVAKG